MADELLIKKSLVYNGKEASNGAPGFTIAEKSWSIDQDGLDYQRGTQSINSTTAEAIGSQGDIGTYGWCRVAHLSSAGTVRIGLSAQTSGQMAMMLEPGDPPAEFRATAQPYALVASASNSVLIEYAFFEK